MKKKQLPTIELDEIMQAGARWKQLVVRKPDAINTTVGIVLDPRTRAPWRPQSVQAAMTDALEAINTNHVYGLQSQSGNERFLKNLQSKLFKRQGEDILAYQSTGGTRALSLAAAAIRELFGEDKDIPLLIDDGWPNYRNIFRTGFDISSYTHQDFIRGNYRHEACVEAINNLPRQSVVLLQVSGYNNDGLDRSVAQWDEIIELCAKQGHTLILDSAYCGLASPFNDDCYAFNAALNAGVLTFVSFSLSKIMGLYGERLGALFVLNMAHSTSAQQARAYDMLIKKLIRGTESSNARLVAETAAAALSSEKFFEELEQARDRLNENRATMVDRLGARFPQITNGSGLFTVLLKDGFTEAQIEKLAAQAIHVLPSSRINLAGFDDYQATIVADAMADVLGSSSS